MTKPKAFSGNSGSFKIPQRGKSSATFLQSFHRKRKLQIETSKEDINFISRGKPDFENREDSILKIASWLFWTIRGQLEVTKRRGTSANTPQQRKLFGIDCGGRTESCSCGENDFACRDKSKVLAHFGIFSWLRFWCEGKKSIVWNLKRLRQISSLWQRPTWMIPNL